MKEHEGYHLHQDGGFFELFLKTEKHKTAEDVFPADQVHEGLQAVSEEIKTLFCVITLKVAEVRSRNQDGNTKKANDDNVRPPYPDPSQPQPEVQRILLQEQKHAHRNDGVV